MGKLFHGKNKYMDDEFDGEEFADDEMMKEEVDYKDRIESDTVEDDDADGVEIDSEEDRRIYRRRRRIRNQVIAYSVVLVIMAVVITGGVVIVRSMTGTLKEKRLAEEQAEIQEQLQAEQEAEVSHDVVIDAPEPMDTEIEPEPEVDYLGERVNSYISEMPLEDKVAGLFIVTPEALTGVTAAVRAGEGTQTALNEYAVGGLIYSDKNIVSEEQLKEMLSGTISMSKYPIFLAVYEEGGSVSRVAGSSIDVIQVDDMASIGASGDTTQAYEAGLTIGRYLKDLGFNLDLAPIADVAGSESSALGDRIFGSDAQLVADMVSNVVDGIEGTGVSSCLKHFPGIGYAESDTQGGRVEATKTLDEMRSTDFIPFIAGIEAGADFVMVSHITVPDADTVPSTLSKTIVTDILRNELDFQGVVVTDALNTGAITGYYTTEDAVVKAIQAGADMLLMPDDFKAAYDALLAAVQDGTISEERIDQSLERIYRVKYEGMLD